MVVFNIVGRVAKDKDFLEPLFICLSGLKSKNVQFRLNVIGEIWEKAIHDRLLTLAKELAITESVFFTEKSIRYNNMDEEILNGYFLNFSVGNFVGYSTIEGIAMGLKTIIINVDQDFDEKDINEISFCNKITDLYNVACKISENEKETRQQIISENLLRKNDYFLTKKDSEFLMSIF